MKKGKVPHWQNRPFNSTDEKVAFVGIASGNGTRISLIREYCVNDDKERRRITDRGADFIHRC